MKEKKRYFFFPTYSDLTLENEGRIYIKGKIGTFVFLSKMFGFQVILFILKLYARISIYYEYFVFSDYAFLYGDKHINFLSKI